MQGFRKRLIVAWSVILVMTGCTWVPIIDGAQTIRVFRIGEKRPAGCQMQSEIDVSVKHRLGFYRRNPLKVQDELETLARNEAFEGRANAIQAHEGPIDGRQRFDAFICMKP